MPAGSLLALLDDIASVLDDLATMTKVAAKRTAAILGDDLALNAQQVTGVRADRELPVVWAVAKGSLVNKAILVPVALLLGSVAPWAVTPLLMVGGAYLCFEGAEKLAHRLLHPAAEREAARAEVARALSDPAQDVVAHEKAKIRGAIRTDFVLSAEIVAITLAAVAGSPFGVRAAVLVAISLALTVGVYGFVAALVKLDDVGLRWAGASGTGPAARARRGLGRALVRAAPYLMKALSVVGTAAMFLVGGGILVHGIPPLARAIEAAAGSGVASAVLPTAASAAVGVGAGAVLVAAVEGGKRVLAGRGPRR